MTNDNCKIIYLHKGRKLYKCKWVYKPMYASNGSVERREGILVTKEISQLKRIK